MSGLLRSLLILVSFLSFYGQKARAQTSSIDTTFIHVFDKQNNVEVYTGVYRANFQFRKRRSDRQNYRLLANGNSYIGADVNYKWFSLNYSTAIYGTQLDNRSKAKYTDIRFTLNRKRTTFNPFFTSFTGLLIPTGLTKDRYLPFGGIRFLDTGFDGYYYANSDRFSFRASAYSSQQQKRNAGSVILGITPRWQQIRWQHPSRTTITDTVTYDLLSSNPKWISVVGRIGYTYAFTFREGKWKIETAGLLGGGGVREIGTGMRDFQLTTAFQGWMNAGYTKENYYAYFSARLDSQETDLLLKNMTQISTDFSFTLGYRFHNFKKKILRIL